MSIKICGSTSASLCLEDMFSLAFIFILQLRDQLKLIAMNFKYFLGVKFKNLNGNIRFKFEKGIRYFKNYFI